MSGKPWTEAELKLLRKHYGVMKTRKLAEKLGRSYHCLVSKANKLGLKTRVMFTTEELATVRDLYPNLPTAEVARRIGRPTRPVEVLACRLKLKKSPEYKAKLYAEQSARLERAGVSSRLQPGNVPWNKGVTGWQPDACKATQFRPGNVPPTWVPVGTERVNPDGYLEIKHSDNRYAPKSTNWRAKHLLVWEAAHGPVPKNHAVVFINGDKRDFRLENLELITRVELMLRNSYHNRYPQDLKDVIHARAALTRVINNRKRGQQREEQADASA